MIVASFPYYDTAIDLVTVYISEHTPTKGRQTPESELADCVFMQGRQIYAHPDHRDFVITSLTKGNIPFRLVEKSPTSET